MSFKDDVAKDFDTVFLNADEFADIVTYNGEDVSVLVSSADDDYFTSEDTCIIYGSASGFRDAQKDEVIIFGGDEWKIQDITLSDGIYQIRAGRQNVVI